MRTSLQCLTALVALVLSGPALAAPDCTCRYSGLDFDVGTCTCIFISGQMKKACCGRVLNNTSWNFSSGECPGSEAPAGSSLPASAMKTANIREQAQPATGKLITRQLAQQP